MNYVSIDMVDRRVSSSWWRELVRHFVRAGDEVELRCWKEETEEIEAASWYGTPTEERTEISIRGTVTDELLRELLTEEPTDKSIYNKMTRYFTVNIKNELGYFSSQHYGTEMYLEDLREKDIGFVESVFSPYGDAFSVLVERG